jgi:23S rRNA (pseudouridine1915-N3)-methyltransferase
MRLVLVAVDKIRTPYVAQACDEFRTRLRPYYSYEEIDVRASNGKDPAGAMRDEAERIEKHLREGDRIWLLDRTGVALSSEDLSQRLTDIGRSGASRMIFIVAGTFGADPSLRKRAEFAWSLSPLTFLHEWARAIVLEQLYRAAKIARNEPYHH